MNPNLGNLFSGNFYIHKEYALALVPTLINAFTNVSFVEKKLEDLTSKNVNLHNVASEGETTDQKVCVIISFNQPVIKYTDYWYGWLGTQAYIKILERYRLDPSIAGVVMDVDSGGGQVYGTPEFFEYIQEFVKSKPLVVYTGGYLCSGAYYFAAAASWIVAHKRADAIGSIGAYTVIADYDGLWEKLGAKIHTIYSDMSEDKNKHYRGVVDGTDPDYKKYIKEDLNPIVISFHNDMKSVRPQLKEEVFKGGTWSGSDSVELGLVDENGSLQTAISKVYELAASNESNSNNNNSKNQKKTMSKMTKSFPLIQALIGLEGEGIPTVSTITGKSGVQITEAHLAAIETALSGHETAVTTANGKVTTAEGKVTKIEGAIDTAIETAGLTAEVGADATAETKITLLSNKVVEYGKKPAAKGSKPKSEGDTVEEEEQSTSIFESIIK